MVYVDNLFLDPTTRNRTLRELQNHLHRLGPATRVMVVTFERGLHIRQPFTTDPRQVEAALDDVQRVAGLGAARDTERRTVIDRIEASRNVLEANSAVELYAESTADDARRSIEAMQHLVASLAGLPGRKALLHVSDGLPMTAGEDLFLLADLRHLEGSSGPLRAMRYRVRRELEDLTAQAASNRVVFYTLDARGLGAHAGLSAEHGGTRTASTLEADTAYDFNRQEPLLMMAADTGGLATVNSNNIRGALERMVTDFGTYYSLGYSPAHFGDGRYHEVRVEVPGRRGASVRHRHGYRDKTVEVRVGEATLGALLYGAADNPLGVTVTTGRPAAAEHGNFLVPVEVRVPLGRLAFLPRDGVRVGRVRVAVVAASREGDTSTPSQEVAPIEIAEADFERAHGQGWVYAAQVLVRPGRNRLAIGVRDEISGEDAFVRAVLDVGP